MAECTAYTAIEVSGAGTSEVNGTYIPYSTNIIIESDPSTVFTIFTKDGLDSYPRIRAESVFGSNYQWYIRTSSGESGATASYVSNEGLYDVATPVNCPSDVAGWSAILDALEPTPTVTGVTGGGGGGNTAPTFGLPADVVALITSRFGSVANFLRLRNQGQV